MKITNFIIIIIVSCSCLKAYAQGTSQVKEVFADADTCNTQIIQAAIDACIMLAESAASNDIDGIRNAKMALQECNTVPFGPIRQLDKKENQSLEGHLVFTAEFADSLVNGRNAYQNADLINKTRIQRGQTENGKILTKTFLIKAKGKSKYKFISHGHQELAVVAEPGGLISTRIQAINTNKGINVWHNDTTNVKKGKNCRKTAFELPKQPSSSVILEITNCTNKDISVVVISN